MNTATSRLSRVFTSVALLACGVVIALATALVFVVYVTSTVNAHSSPLVSRILTDEVWFAGSALIAAMMIKLGLWVLRGGSVQIVIHHPQTGV